MAHNRRCSNSMSDPRRCKCSCNGDYHGGTYSSLGIANSGSGKQDGPHTGTSKGLAPMLREPRNSSAPVHRAVTEIIDWLAANPTTADQATAIADIVAEQTVAALKKYGPAAPRQELTLNHFLCGLLAAFAQAIDKLKHMLDQVPDTVISLIVGRSDQLGLSAVAVRVAVQASWRLIMQLPVFGQIDSLLRATRIAAVLACPALDEHEEVIQNCLYPLGGDVVSAATMWRLRELFPPRDVS
jgi:hypothetical protein